MVSILYGRLIDYRKMEYLRKTQVLRPQMLLLRYGKGYGKSMLPTRSGTLCGDHSEIHSLQNETYRSRISWWMKLALSVRMGRKWYCILCGIVNMPKWFGRLTGASWTYTRNSTGPLWNYLRWWIRRVHLSNGMVCNHSLEFMAKAKSDPGALNHLAAIWDWKESKSNGGGILWRWETEAIGDSQTCQG